MTSAPMEHDRSEWERHPGFEGMAGLLMHIHDSFRASSAALVRLADETLDDHVLARMRALYIPLERTLHHHHHAEEVMLFPLLRDLGGQDPSALVDDHGALMARLDEVTAALGVPSASLAGLLRTLDDELRDHLDREEAAAVPVLLEMTPAQAARLFHGLG